MSNRVEERIKKVMSAVFQIPIEEINANSTTDTVESWDSLNHMNLVVALEEEFGIQFSDDEIFEMMNYKLIEVIVTSKLNDI